MTKFAVLMNTVDGQHWVVNREEETALYDSFADAAAIAYMGIRLGNMTHTWAEVTAVHSNGVYGEAYRIRRTN